VARGQQGVIEASNPKWERQWKRYQERREQRVPKIGAVLSKTKRRTPTVQLKKGTAWWSDEEKAGGPKSEKETQHSSPTGADGTSKR